MPKQKHDYIKLKAEFLKSDFAEVKGFITAKGLRYNSERAKRTKGWAKEKKENDNKVLVQATERAIAKNANSLEIPMEQLSIAKRDAVNKIINMMMDEKKPLDVADMERCIKIIRTEMGLPNAYNKNENMNYDKIEGIHIVWGGNPADNGENNKLKEV